MGLGGREALLDHGLDVYSSTQISQRTQLRTPSSPLGRYIYPGLVTIFNLDLDWPLPLCSLAFNLELGVAFTSSINWTTHRSRAFPGTGPEQLHTCRTEAYYGRIPS